MPSSLKMNFYNNVQHITNFNNQNNSIDVQQQIILGGKKNRKCSLLFLQGNKHCSSCSGK